jgi:2-keto-4-pentenoate hydratase/2-oxohepta-3-ene-1,7-dioic acid hydratase in catechol pathway
MRIVKFQTKRSAPQFGWVLDDQVGQIEGDIFGVYQRNEANIPLEDVKLLPPIQPSKIICVGRNYIAHAQEHGVEVPEVPLLFFKPPSSIIATNETIHIPPQSDQVEHEAELVVVIGRQGRWITPEDAINHTFGYTIANDVTARDLQIRDDQWTRAKGFDTFCPLGPWIETEFNPADALVTCRVNQEMRQMASTRDMVFSIDQLIAFASSIMTLSPGDILLTGTPAGVSPLSPGDNVEVEIEGIGVLRNPVSAEPDRS